MTLRLDNSACLESWYRKVRPGTELGVCVLYAELTGWPGLISRKHRPVYWSPSSRTALAEAELEYDDNHRCTAAFVKFPILRLPDILKGHPAIKQSSISALIWTTTPWTLPANMAIAVRNDIEYSVVEFSMDDASPSGDQIIVAKDRIEHVLSHLPEDTRVTTIIPSISGSQLATGHSAAFNLFTGRDSTIVHADFVTATAGTGLVHMAPGHGMDDYQVCQQNNIEPAFAPVDDEGRYTADVFISHVDGKTFQGLDVQTSGVTAVLDVLTEPSEYLPIGIHDAGSSLLLTSHNFTHKNPIDWRTKQPVIVRATAQWFADVSAIKDRALSALDDVHFIPEGGKVRLKNFVEGRSQWCISRQRVWGVPIPALYNAQTGEVCVSPDSVDHIISTIEKKGTDAWFSDSEDDPSWLHSSLRPGQWIRGRDTMDVWFDSGTTWTMLGKRGEGVQLSDVYSEGTDQHRGWFQSSLLTAIATQNPNEKPLAPFKALATHGFTLDGKGKKMSKSLGNVIGPEEIISGTLIPASTKAKNKNKKDSGQLSPVRARVQSNLGPDILRLWVASSDYTKDVSISQPVLQSVQQALQKYRVTFKFLLGVLHDYPSPYPQRSFLMELGFADQVILHQLAKCSQAVFSAYGEYKFYVGINEINRFVNNDLSAFYFEIVKDRLYAGTSAARRHTQTILVHIMQELLKMLGPATPHLVEEVWGWLPNVMKQSQSLQDAESMDLELHPLRQVWDRPFDAAQAGVTNGESLEGPIKIFRMISSAVKTAQEEARAARQLGSGLGCRVVLCLHNEAGTAEREVAWLSTADLASLLVVSRAELQPWDYSPAEDVEWRYEQPISTGTSDGSHGQNIWGRVLVLPPAGEKCVRCWKYTAEEQTLPCASCREAIAETLQ